ncbi:hypothetical protein M0805_006351 [Coniferiporia weirii]|nr:hypothetical protein M0805_006351 [Coniferiporia weirii]
MDKSSKASNRHDAHRPLAFWHVAVNATKGLFGQPSRAAPDDDATTAAASTSSGTVPPAADMRKRRVRKSTSSPSLKDKENRSRHGLNNTDFSPSPSSFFNSHSLNQSPRKTRTAHPVGRPIISPPSLPQHLDSFDFPHPRLPYPLSPMPSPSGSTFSFKAPFIQSSSNLSSGLPVSENDSAGPGCGPSNPCDSRLVRRRTKSAPGIKLGIRPFFSPGLPTAVEVDNNEPFSPVIIDIASPSTASFSSRSVETPKMSSECFTQFTSPVVHSPRSFTSVKRKPVPRHLYTEPPDHDPSTPCTPLLTPVPETPPASLPPPGAARPTGLSSLHTPLLPSSELILRSCGPSRTHRRDLALLPIGQPKASSSNTTRGQRRRSISERGLGRSSGGYGLPSPWFTADSNGSITPLITPSEESAPFSLADGLPPPPRVPPLSPPQTPLRISEELSAASDDGSAYSALSRGGGLSPLTDEEIIAIRTFLHRHTTGHRARQRRKGIRDLSLHSIRHGGSPAPSGLYDRILESYLDDDDFFSTSGSEDDEDTESHAPPSTLETNSTSALSLLRPYEQEQDDDADGALNTGQDEVGTPIDHVNRGTFGYYDVPMVRDPRVRKNSGEIYAYAYIPSDSEVDMLSVHREEWRDTGGDFGNMAQVMKSLHSAEAFSTALGAQEDDFECSDNVHDLERSSSVYYRPMSGCMPHEDESLSGLRISRQPLVPRTLNSDSESERSLSSSTSASFSISTLAGGSALTPGIGLKIIPQEQFAYFDTYDRNRSCTFVGCRDENDSEGSPTTLACTSSSPRRNQHHLDDMEGGGIERLSTSFDRLQSSFAKLRAQTPDVESLDVQRTTGASSPMLKPALHIKSGSNIAPAVVGLPSPADTVATYPPFTRSFSQGCTGQKPATLDNVSGKACTNLFTDEASTAPAANVRSFMNLTPNDPEPKPRSRVRLRQLFSRANLRTPTGRKSATDSKSRTS